MTRLTYLTPGLFATLCLAASCSKSNSKPNTTTTTTTTTTTSSTDTLEINCSIPFFGSQSELIVSEPGGKILLDAVVTSGTAPIVATLQTNDTLVDATVIGQYVHGSLTEIETFKSVNLGRLSSLVRNSYNLSYKMPAPTQAQIVYYNIPSQIDLSSPNDSVCFTSYPSYSGGEGMVKSPNNHYVTVSYNGDFGNLHYLLFPQVGLYNIHNQQNAVDSVDCTHLDTAVMLTFNRPVPFTSAGYSSLYGIFDTTDLSKAISFTSFIWPYTKAGVDFEYPPIPVQKYEMNYFATYSNNDQLNYYSYTNTLSQTLPLPQESDFSVSSAQTDNFSVTFLNTKPTNYQIVLGADTTLNYTMYVSPDSIATLHPLTYLTNLKSKLLQNANLSKLQLWQLQLLDFNGLDYLHYFSYITNPSAIQTHRPTWVASLTRNYN
ncbi:MAG TPA: hypothetical protein VGS79_26400 [Puia sp.]|nr:hypothetical protein [Puia sp.]